MFLCDVAGLVSEEAVRRRAGESGGLPGVETLERGDGPDGVYSALASVRLEAPAYDVFRRLCDPEENKRIFDRTCASVNYRHILEEDPEEQSRLIEVSKTGRWRILGIPVHFESTVFAVEDWKSLEIRFRIKSSGTMQHFSGFWKMCPLRQNETVVLFYQEAVPSIPMPKLFRAFLQASSGRCAAPFWRTCATPRAPGAPGRCPTAGRRSAAARGPRRSRRDEGGREKRGSGG
ncbi:unnamed protein product [Prorocentrum cordatum]|uniref:Coenzyme Q-binding protein COQ10 START domain-containing protein n=1 Tax=Prorocentrum cordatum TaxID=2364126 RepID=A0ABN9X208_9DINO|nr:unnamed protein product [Polarella glacialis]